MRVKIFIDFWNFNLNWKDRTPEQERCDWSSISKELHQHAQNILSQANLGSTSLEETRIYASWEGTKDYKLKNWLHSYLDRLPGVRVFSVERHWKKRPIHCRSCNYNIIKCPQCNSDLGRAAEKTIDSMIVTDLITLAWENTYDVAILLSSDKDFIPAVEALQRKNIKIINATWKGHGHELAKISWASFDMDDILTRLYRKT